jgi:hypothetical protein
MMLPFKIRWFCLLVALSFLAQCRSRSNLPSSAEEAIAKKQWSDADLNSLKSGFRLYNGKCGKCHELYKPEEYSEDDWFDILPKMSRKAHLSGDEQDLIKRFLLTRRIYALERKKK